MRRLLLLVPLVGLLSCMSPASPTPVAISCQPSGASPAPAAFSVIPAPATAAAAEQTAIAMVRACELPKTVTDLSSSSKPATGVQQGPNGGQAIWLVQVDVTVVEASPGATYQAHFLVEVNQASGVPTIVGQG